MRFRRITSHAIEQYCLRVHSDVAYYASHPGVLHEIQERASKAQPSSYSPKNFFSGRRGVRARNVSLFQDSTLIYARRDNEVITIIPLPGTSRISDMLHEAILKKRQ